MNIPAGRMVRGWAARTPLRSARGVVNSAGRFGPRSRGSNLLTSVGVAYISTIVVNCAQFREGASITAAQDTRSDAASPR